MGNTSSDESEGPIHESEGPIHESEDPIYRIICYGKKDYSLAIRGGKVVVALINPFDRYQHWIKDEKHGATIKDSEGQPAFAVVNRATGQAISHGPIEKPVPLVPYNMNSCGESVLWTMSKEIEGIGNICRADLISNICVAKDGIFDVRIMHLYRIGFEYQDFRWKFEKVSPSSCITLFRPSQHTVKISCQVKVGYNLAIDKDGSAVLLVPANPKDKYQHWIKEMAYGVPVRDSVGLKAFALVNKATGKAIKHGFGHNYLVQVAPFNQNYMDHSLLWTKYKAKDGSGFQKIRMQSNIQLFFSIFDKGLGNSPLVGLSRFDYSSDAYQNWKIEDFE